MAPKGGAYITSVSQLGSIIRNGIGWRVQTTAAMEDGFMRTVYGPTRQHKTDACADRERARAARTRKEYGDILSRMKISRIIGSIGSHGKGWRVNVTVKTRSTHGPYRVNKCDAVADLKQIRAGKTGEECRSILLQLKKATSSETEEEAKSRRRRVTVSRLGIVSQHSNGWRVTAAPIDGTIVGPCRAHRSEVDADLKHCRTAETREEYRNIIMSLKLTAGKRAAQEYRDNPRRSQKTTQTSIDGENKDDARPRMYESIKEQEIVNHDCTAIYSDLSASVLIQSSSETEEIGGTYSQTEKMRELQPQSQKMR